LNQWNQTYYFSILLSFSRLQNNFVSTTLRLCLRLEVQGVTNSSHDEIEKLVLFDFIMAAQILKSFGHFQFGTKVAMVEVKAGEE